MSKSIFDDFLDDIENNFELIECDALAAIERLETPAEGDNDKLVLRTMSGLFERLATWQRSWGLPLRAFQEWVLAYKRFQLTMMQVTYTSLFSLANFTTFFTHPSPLPSPTISYISSTPPSLPSLNTSPTPHRNRASSILYLSTTRKCFHLHRTSRGLEFSQDMQGV